MRSEEEKATADEAGQGGVQESHPQVLKTNTAATATAATRRDDDGGDGGGDGSEERQQRAATPPVNLAEKFIFNQGMRLSLGALAGMRQPVRDTPEIKQADMEVEKKTVIQGIVCAVYRCRAHGFFLCVCSRCALFSVFLIPVLFPSIVALSPAPSPPQTKYQQRPYSSA